jgi:hypothetical protein
MSCWVVPALAAEIWGIPLQRVLDAIRLGKLPTRSAIGLTFVDVAPGSPTAPTGYRPPAARPDTFTPASGASPDQQEMREQELLSTVDEYEEGKLDWRDARRSAARLRRAPRRMAA